MEVQSLGWLFLLPVKLGGWSREMISEEELWAAKAEAVQALVHTHAPGSWPGTIAEPGPWPIFLLFFFPLLGKKGARLSWPEKAKLPQPFVACKAEYRLSLSGRVTQSISVVYLQQRVEGTALNYVGWRGARRRAVVGGGSAVFLNFHFWFSAKLERGCLIVTLF